ncbi:Glycosyltransferase involved in cell wall bisynthesis [Caloramator fervidus]|uniref:Glycosyltransferase involved in cell wall bisynthesis n=1 Tax=Caloramator fervidus TaxID=29344 RepID=A0A1H5SYN4_9CLOT|nr:glycosyltransferase [Caloramator fervidus]SEF55629.1 Glycosyltransferase involved in cell wall bisynthesis [Caloramator fervidus]
MDIICFSAVNWEPLMTRIQSLMLRIPKHNRIFYIEPPSTLISPLKDSKRWEDYIKWLNNPIKVIDNVYVFKLPPILPFYNKNIMVNKVNQYFIAKYLNLLFKKYKVSKPILWIYNPFNVDILKYVDYSCVIYDCVDKHSEFKGLINKEIVEGYEKKLCKLSNVVFATAEALYDNVKLYNDNTYLVPNGVDFDLFNSVDLMNYERPLELKNLKGKILGFIGAVKEWVDLELVYKVACKKHDWNFVFIGPLASLEIISRLKSLNNVCFIEPKPQKDLPRYIKHFDVCLNLFKKSELTKNVSPLKFYEYLATGKPIISTDMPHIRKFSDLIYIVEDEEDFIKKCEDIFNGEDDIKKQKRIEIAKKASWDNRMNDILEYIKNVCKINLREGDKP